MNLPAGPEPLPGESQTPPARPIDRQMLDEIFGNVLPDTTNDERDGSAGDSHTEQWYRDNRPPHHG